MGKTACAVHWAAATETPTQPAQKSPAHSHTNTGPHLLNTYSWWEVIDTDFVEKGELQQLDPRCSVDPQECRGSQLRELRGDCCSQPPDTGVALGESGCGTQEGQYVIQREMEIHTHKYIHLCVYIFMYIKRGG